MERLALVAVVVLAVGIWVHPSLTGRGKPVVPEARAAAPSDPSPAKFKTIRGQPGFWRAAQTDDGVWWFFSPTDQCEFLNMVTTVQPYQEARDPNGIQFISKDWDGGVGTGGNIDAWAKRTLDRVRELGFKGLGAWSNSAFHNYDVPMTRDLNIWTWMKADQKRFYTPTWQATAERAVREQVIPLRDNRNLIGYFIDNEIDWGDGFSGPSHYFNHLPADDPNRVEVVKVMQSIWPTIQEFNAAWNVQLTDWSELQTWETIPHSEVYSRLYSAWLAHLAGDYFRTTCALIRKHDPNHLILGVRFRGYALREVVRASREHTDVQSINYYVGDGRLDAEMFRMMHEESGQPIMVTEYSFHALDGRSGNRNTVGFSAQVPDQQARADGYRQITQRMARVPYVIGADWFQWMDEPPGGRTNDGEDVNFGIVDVDDKSYELLAQAVRETAPQLNSLHAAAAIDDQHDVWRESFADKPVARAPFLSNPIKLNGDLSDWPDNALMPGIRHSQTIGVNRSELPVPNVLVGWREDGLYFGFEVFDRDIQGAPPKGWWWTRDHVEFWLSTRPPEPDQDGYNLYSHQFFFTPIDWPGDDGLLGQVGQWHRSGDALEDHRIPHTDMKNAVRIFPDRYVVEIFIPKDSLHGFDPAQHSRLAFNIHIRNFQQATDYFWSAPKEVMTQLRPGTWGTLMLDPATGSNLASGR